MLELLRISNYAIIDDLEVEFGEGLTTITGETGAGKSILIGSLKLALGERASADVIRTGASRATVEAVFRLNGSRLPGFMNDGAFADDETDGHRVILRREVLASGSRNYINNRSATAAQLREIAERLIDMHGQNQQTSLLDTALQLRQLDEFGSHARELQTYGQAWAAYRAATARVQELRTNTGDAERRLAFLKFQVEEISAADLTPGEDEQLSVERKRLQNAERLRISCQIVIDALYDSDAGQTPATALLGAAVRTLGEIAVMDPSQAKLAEDAESIRYSIEDLASRVRDYAESVSADPARLASIDDRLDAIRTLKRKYGSTIDEVLAAATQMKAELESIENHDEALASAEKQLALAISALADAGNALSASRRKAAAAFQKRVEVEVRQLELPRAVFRVQLSTRDSHENWTGSGADTIEFMVTLNPGEEPRPLRKVASGGEISRIMLAIETVLAAKLEVPTLIFDEIDIGISGEAAARVGQKLRTLGESRQVICITHLPQVAAQGNRHLIVQKDVHGERTLVKVAEVSGNARVDKLAEMLAGREADHTARKYAEQLLKRK